MVSKNDGKINPLQNVDFSMPFNILADRYASNEILGIFSVEGKIVLERQFWIALMETQDKLGHKVDKKVIDDYKKVTNKVDLHSINQREKQSKHDVKARIEEFNALAGHEKIHQGLTSRDLTENIEQLQIKTALSVIHKKVIATLIRLSARAKEHANLTLAGRTHNVAAQATTLGKRFANAGQELLLAEKHLANFINDYPLRGIKGPVGTQQDILNLFGDEKTVEEFETTIAKHLGFNKILGSVGQIYPRSLDLELVNTMQQLAAGPSSLATSLRLMAGHELLTEGFKKGQVGSSAMPHKMNARTCERINGFKKILDGYGTMAAGVSGNQWNEGDVSDSVVRRVMIPDSFYTIDGLLDNFMTVLDEMGVYPAVINSELDRYLPFLQTTAVLMEALKSGGNREEVHDAIKKHSIDVALEMREKGLEHNNLLDRLAADERIPLDRDRIDKISRDKASLTGRAVKQVEVFVSQVEKLAKDHPEAASYSPNEIL